MARSFTEMRESMSAKPWKKSSVLWTDPERKMTATNIHRAAVECFDVPNPNDGMPLECSVLRIVTGRVFQQEKKLQVKHSVRWKAD